MAREEVGRSTGWLGSQDRVTIRDTRTGDTYEGRGSSHAAARAEADKAADETNRSGGLISSWFSS